MSKLAMVEPNHPALTTVAEPVHQMYYESPEGLSIIRHQLDQMFEILQRDIGGKRGVGLAAPQVGLSQRFFVINYGGPFSPFINPEIIKVDEKKGKSNDTEGCLSFPKEREVYIQRWNRIKVRYIHPDKGLTSHYLQGFKARIFQHELDHLNGVTIITHRDASHDETSIQ